MWSGYMFWMYLYLYIVWEMPLVFQLGSLLRCANLGLQETNWTHAEYVLRPREQLADVKCVLLRAGQNLHLEHDIPFGTAKTYLGLGFPCREVVMINNIGHPDLQTSTLPQKARTRDTLLPLILNGAAACGQRKPNEPTHFIYRCAAVCIEGDGG
jgi:hypothetical protein